MLRGQCGMERRCCARCGAVPSLHRTRPGAVLGHHSPLLGDGDDLNTKAKRENENETCAGPSDYLLTRPLSGGSKCG